jgi:hypothetical protein
MCEVINLIRLDIKLLILRLTYKLLLETEGSTRLKFTVRFRVSDQRNKAC